MSRPDPFAPVRDLLARTRREGGLTQDALADQSQVETLWIANTENRRMSLRLPQDWANFSAHCRALGLDPWQVLGTAGVI